MHSTVTSLVVFSTATAHLKTSTTPQPSFFLLILEDDEAEIELFELLLKKYFPNWQHVIVRSGDELLEFLKTEPPVSLLLLDVYLPGKDGIAVLEEVRQIDHYQRLPVVGFSNKASRSAIDALMLQGVSAFFEKPLSSDAMVNLLRKLPTIGR